MRRMLKGTAVAAILLAGAASAVNFQPVDLAYLRQREILNPSVRLRLDKASGSGTVIHSGDDGVFVLTNAHVVQSTIDDHPGDFKSIKIAVDSWLFLKPSAPALPIRLHATIVASDKESDLALLKVSESDYRTDFVAMIEDPSDVLTPTERLYAVGGALGNRPFVTEGMISTTDMDIGPGEGKIQISAPIAPGNSGGTAYVIRDNHNVMIGVPEAVEGLPVGSDGEAHVIVPHLGIVIPMATVRGFLGANGKTWLAPHRKSTIVGWAR